MSELRPIAFRVLCAMATAELLQEASITDGEWKDRIKDRLVKQGWAYPADPEMLIRAMNAANAVHEKRHGPRPIPMPPQPTPKIYEAPQADPPWSGHQRTEGWKGIEALLAKLRNSQT